MKAPRWPISGDSGPPVETYNRISGLTGRNGSRVRGAIVRSSAGARIGKVPPQWITVHQRNVPSHWIVADGEVASGMVGYSSVPYSLRPESDSLDRVCICHRTKWSHGPDQCLGIGPSSRPATPEPWCMVTYNVVWALPLDSARRHECLASDGYAFPMASDTMVRPSASIGRTEGETWLQQ